jgi:ferritin-like metal-binding protein YciE
MAESDLQEQLVKYLTDAHSIEEQALPQLRAAPKIAGDERLAEAFREHETETEEQKRLVQERLEALGGSPSKVKDAVMKAGGVGFSLFAKSQPDTPGKLTAHAYSFEHLELASYELLLRVAERAGDAETADAARRIRDQEQAMSERLASLFDAAVDASLAEKDADELEAEVVKYLTDAHAIEGQSIQLLTLGPRMASDPATAKVYNDHLEESRAQQTVLEARLDAHGEGPSKLKDAALRLGAFNWGAFFQAQPDTPGKLAAFVYAVEHLEIGGYELLKRVVERAGDRDTAQAVERIIAQERAAAGIIAGEWDRAVEASLAAQGVPAAG